MLYRLKEYLIDDRNFENISKTYGDLAGVCNAALRNYGNYVGYTRASSTDNTNKRTVIWNLERIIKFVGGVENLAGKTFDTGDLELGKKVAQFFIKNTNPNMSDFMDKFDKAFVYDEDSTKNYRENDRWAKAEIFNERLVLNAVAKAARDIDSTSNWSAKASIPVIKSVTEYKGKTPKGRATIYHKIEFGDFQTNEDLMYFFMASMNQKIWESYNTLNRGKSEKDDVGTNVSDTSKAALSNALDNAQITDFNDWFNLSLLAIIKGIKKPVGHEINRRTGLESMDSYNQCFFNTKEVMNFLDFSNKDFKLTDEDGREVGIFGAVASRLFTIKGNRSMEMPKTFLGKFIHEFRDEKRNPSDCINGDLKNSPIKSIESDSEDNSKLDAKPLVKKAISDWQDSEELKELKADTVDIVQNVLLNPKIIEDVKKKLSPRPKAVRIDGDDSIVLDLFLSLIASKGQLMGTIVNSGHFLVGTKYSLKDWKVKGLDTLPRLRRFCEENCEDSTSFLNSLSGEKGLYNLMGIRGKDGKFLNYFDFEEKDGKFVESNTGYYEKMNKEFEDTFKNQPISKKSIRELERIVNTLLKEDLENNISATRVCRNYALQVQGKIDFDLGLNGNRTTDVSSGNNNGIRQALEYLVVKLNSYSSESKESNGSFMANIRRNLKSNKNISYLLNVLENIIFDEDNIDFHGVKSTFMDKFNESKKRLFNRIFMKSFKESLFDNIYIQSK